MHEHMRLLPERVEISVSARSHDEDRGKSNKATLSIIAPWTWEVTLLGGGGRTLYTGGGCTLGGSSVVLQNQ